MSSICCSANEQFIKKKSVNCIIIIKQSRVSCGLKYDIFKTSRYCIKRIIKYENMKEKKTMAHCD